MGKKFRYENPMLIDLRDDQSCTGASCSTGPSIDYFDCHNGSCETSTECGTGTKAESCCSGSLACSIYYFGGCESGTSVSGACSTGSDGAASKYCYCISNGAAASYQCAPMGTISGSCGCGNNNGT